MNWLDFFASVFASLVSMAWPAALVLCVWLFRREIGPLIPRMRLKHKDTEFSFRLDEVEAAMETVEDQPVPQSVPWNPSEYRSQFEQLADVSPAAAILFARRNIENAVKSRLDIEGISKPYNTNFWSGVQILRKKGIIPENIAELLSELRSIGNAAAHDRDFEITKDEAMRFKSLADSAIGHLYFELPEPNEISDN
ncbi:DUF4145 domain-containing protein [Consotaella aegiceratis]|uniref:DUF4145 domain-containing protein n=1 Tax=Consotaella aegiceratis TaxID=3097961 RepID=UPI002F41ABB7